MKCRSGYKCIIVESFITNEPGHRYPIEIRPIPGQEYSSTMLVECSMKMRTDYPVGTKFRLCVAAKQKEQSRPHLYSYHAWPFEVLE
jgi:hypothetical protein